MAFCETQMGNSNSNSAVQDPPRDIVALLFDRRTGDVYLCGHLHTLNGYMPAMYTRHPAGNLELEVGDWKDNRV